MISKSKMIFLFVILFSICTTSAFSNYAWNKIKGNATDIAINDKGIVYVVSSKKKQVYRWDNYKQDWVALVKASGNISKIAASKKGMLLGVVKGKVHKYASKKWTPLGDFSALDIGIGPKGRVWAIERHKKIATWDSKRKKWLSLKTTGTIVAGKKPMAVDVDKNGNPIVVFRDNSVVHYNVSKRKWKKLSSVKLIDIACTSSGYFYGLGYSGNIFKWNRPKQSWDKQTKLKKLKSGFTRISVLPNGNPWVILANGDIYNRIDKVFTDFLPSKHGYHFTNSFQFNATIKFDVGVFESFVPKDYYTYNIKESYGLCGGMALGAHEYFVQNRKIPKDTQTPKKGDRHYDFLLDRLYVSFGEPSFENLRKALSWWGSIEYKETLLEEDTKMELPKIIKRLDKKDPVQLILMYQTKTTGSPWENHQVLAYGYEKDYSTLRIFIYDPNRPDRDDIVITYSKKTNGKYYLYQNGYSKPKKI